MRIQIEVPADPRVQEHLNRNPRVLAAESRSLVLSESLSDYPHS